MAHKLVIGIFLSICIIFAMSHNANALEFTLNLNDYTLSRNLTRRPIDIIVNDNALCSNSFQCVVYNSTNFARVQKFKITQGYDFKAGDIVKMTALIGSQKNDGSYTSIVPFIQRNFTTNNSNLIYLGFDVHSVNDRNFISSQGYGPGIDEYFTQLQSVYNQLDLVDYYFSVQVDGNYNIGFESNNYNSVLGDIFSLSSYSSSSSVIFSVQALQTWSPVESKENKEVEQKTQEAVNQSAESGESSQGSVEGSTQNLMSAGASIISALSNAPATDCNINMTTSGSSSAFTGAIGSVNLCSGVPSGVLTMVQGIVALVFTPIVLYYTYSIITTIYKQFREYNS